MSGEKLKPGKDQTVITRAGVIREGKPINHLLNKTQETSDLQMTPEIFARHVSSSINPTPRDTDKPEDTPANSS
ncbi:MAG: hypothetical protein PVJ52_00775 [Candidatus Woesebacteria bacterium]|jgi:hypothetical protein